ncbi:MAG: XdhC family protein [Planctomycetota bacterium]
MAHPLQELIRRADAGETLAVCVLAKTTGSTPQKAGAIMVVASNGTTSGTIGGGCVEAEARTQALRRLAKDSGHAGEHDVLLRFPLDRDYGWDDGLICGGVMFVAIQVLEHPEQVTPWRHATSAIENGRAAEVTLNLKDENGNAVEVIFAREPTPRLVIAGAGHVGEALARVADGLGFAVTVIDDRADAASPERFPRASRIIGPIERELANQSLDERHYVVIVTRGHQHDGDALAAVVGSQAKYIGLIGSRRKTLAIFERLRGEGVSADSLRRVRSPIGLRIGAVSPEEIAVSIAAELIACRRDVALDASATMQVSPKQLDRQTKADRNRKPPNPTSRT